MIWVQFPFWTLTTKSNSVHNMIKPIQTENKQEPNLKVFWETQIPTECITMQNTLDFQKKEYERLKTKLLLNRKKDVSYFESIEQFKRSAYSYGYCICLVVRVSVSAQGVNVRVIDYEGSYNLNLSESLHQAHQLIEGIQIGAYLTKGAPKKFSGFKETFNPITSNLGFVVGQPEVLHLESYGFAGFTETPWENTAKGKMVFASDIHVGSKLFLRENFIALLTYINEHKIRYLLLCGDLVDGNDVYPGHWKQIDQPSAIDQYKELAKLISILNPEVKVIILPGNHDSCRRVQPQFFTEDIKKIFLDQRPDTVVLSNPCYIQLDGLYIYITHGTSHPSIINAHSRLKNTNLCDTLQYLSEINNISPIKSAVPIIPNTHMYHMIPEKTNIICSGHMHNQSFKVIKNRLLLCLGAWQNLTQYMKLLGIEPDIAQCIQVDLEDPQKTKCLDFRNDMTQERSFMKSNL